MNVCPSTFTIPNTNVSLQEWENQSCPQKLDLLLGDEKGKVTDTVACLKRKAPPGCGDQFDRIRDQIQKCTKTRREKKVRAESATTLTPQEIFELHCLCKEFHPLVYSKLLDFSQKYLGTRDLDKNEICTKFSQKYPEVKDLSTQNDLGTWISDHSSEEINEMVQGKILEDCKCASVLPDLSDLSDLDKKTKVFNLLDLQDPISFDLLQDFVRLLPSDERLVNWSSVLGIRGGRHPWINTALPSDIAAKIGPDKKTQEQWLRDLRRDWGWTYHPSIHPPVSPQEIKEKLFSPVQYIPLAIPLAERQIRFQFQDFSFQPITIFPGERVSHVYERWRRRVQEQKTENILRAQGGFPPYSEWDVYFSRLTQNGMTFFPGSTPAVNVSYPSERIEDPGNEIFLWFPLFNGGPKMKKQRKQAIWIMLSPPLLLFLSPYQHVADIRRLLVAGSESKSSLPPSYQLISFCGDKNSPRKQTRTRLSDDLQIRALPREKKGNHTICPLYVIER